MKGLQINPCVPSDFGDFKIEREYRGAKYHISVKTNNTEKGVKSMTVNGSPVEGNVIPYDKDVKEYNVTVEMG